MARTGLEHVLSNGSKLFGYAWKIEKPSAHVMIVTGMEEHSTRYDDFAKYLNKAGYDVFCLDHFGQGETAKNNPGTKGQMPQHAFRLFTEAVNQFILTLKKDGLPVFLLGHSMGSFASQEYIQRYGSSVDKVVLSGSNGPDFMVKIGSFLAMLTVSKRGYGKPSKFLAGLTFGGFSKAIKNPRTNFDWLSYNEDNVNKYIDDPDCGYGSSKGFYREFLKALARVHRPKFMRKIPKDLPILIIAGEEDPVGHSGVGVTKLEQYYIKFGQTKVKKILYPHMRHEILNETDKQKVYQDVLAFFKK